MKVAVDARMLRAGGIGTYIREIVGPWSTNAAVSRLQLLGRPREIAAWVDSLAPSVPIRITPWEDPPYSVAAQLRWPLSLSSSVRDCDVLFFPHYDAPAFGQSLPYAVTVHDLTQFLLTHQFPLAKRLAGRWLLERVARGAGQVLTVSETTRADLARLGIASGTAVTVIPNGVGDEYHPLDAHEETVARERWHERLPYLLLVGWDRPHKNSTFAVQIVHGLRERGREYRLVLAGPGGRMASVVRREAERLGVSDLVREVSEVRAELLRELYALASGILVPSLYEGFGLPVLEGTACGSPVFASDRGALPETVGPAEVAGLARVLPIDSPARWIEAIERVLSLGVGPDERARAIAHARRYSWIEASGNVLSALREVTERSPKRPLAGSS
ncbi:MAG: glycosyltransferase family 1 protein [Gemmatimonadetes bacterium]|nr:glycosyltransferase family 1 protein [Gemmatimonadota bacterium]